MPGKSSLSKTIKSTPGVFDFAAAQRVSDALGDDFAALPDKVQEFVKGVAGCSPYLRRLIERAPNEALSILSKPPDASLKEAAAILAEARTAPNEVDQLSILRKAKRRAAMTVAFADLGGAWDVMTAARALSGFADAAVENALSAALIRSPLQSTDGFVVIAMGKLGAMELNYSSDIDLIALFDGDRMGVPDKMEAQTLAVRLTRDFVRLLQAQTPDGYVFRTDLRLRPDPGVSNVAMPVSAAETYYEAYGQNWERMAYIKARPCAGDIVLGENFIGALRPFVWRRHLDFAAIENVHGVKRQIHAVKGGGAIEFHGHDIKLGRGGIREIEFYAQTQQLILGGKNPALRARATLDALAALRDHGHISDKSFKELAQSYRYLRHIEHRLQMLNDEQTHRIPESQQDIQRLYMFAGEQTEQGFRERLENCLRKVQNNYAALFESDEDPDNDIGALVFTGVEDHPETLETLSQLGFSRASEVSAAMRRWHAGGLRATRTERARTLLTKLTPHLLKALSRASRPDDAFFIFERFLSQLPAGVQVFSLLLNNLETFDALIRIMTISPFLGKELSNRANFIERLLGNEWSTPPPDPSGYFAACAAAAAAAHDYEEALNAVRRWAGEQRFLIAAQLAVGIAQYDDAARHFTAIADACINTLAPLATHAMQEHHGVIDGELAIIALGRLGAGEMTAVSDIDIMFVYDAPDGATSNGKKPLAAAEYNTRLVRRIVTALSAATEEGALYDVDMQLRPSGGAGPTAVSLSSFRRYYAEDAWTWEVMALIKARVISQNPLGQEVAREIDSIVRRHRYRDIVAADIAEMRERLRTAKAAVTPWDVKNAPGGLTDISFLCQFLALISAERLGRPPRNTEAALDWFAVRGELSEEIASSFKEAWRLFEAVFQISRAATGGILHPDSAGIALNERMASICGRKTIDDAEALLIERQAWAADCLQKALL